MPEEIHQNNGVFGLGAMTKPFASADPESCHAPLLETISMEKENNHNSPSLDGLKLEVALLSRGALLSSSILRACTVMPVPFYDQF